MAEQKQRNRQNSSLTDELRKLFNEYARELKRATELSSKLIDCCFCDATGKKKRADGEFLRDKYGCFVPCEICRGKTKVRA